MDHKIHDVDVAIIHLENIRKSYKLFLRDGYLNDENSGLGSDTLEYEISIIDRIYRELGYEGEKLYCFGKFYAGCGNIYWIIDTDRMTSEEGTKRTDRYVLQKMK